MQSFDPIKNWLIKTGNQVHSNFISICIRSEHLFPTQTLILFQIITFSSIFAYTALGLMFFFMAHRVATVKPYRRLCTSFIGVGPSAQQSLIAWMIPPLPSYWEEKNLACISISRVISPRPIFVTSLLNQLWLRSCTYLYWFLVCAVILCWFWGAGGCAWRYDIKYLNPHLGGSEIIFIFGKYYVSSIAISPFSKT